MLCSSSEDASFLSLDCAASLARAALSWLQPLAVTGLIRLCHGVCAEGALTPAQAAFSALAAALRLLWAATRHPGLVPSHKVILHSANSGLNVVLLCWLMHILNLLYHVRAQDCRSIAKEVASALMTVLFLEAGEGGTYLSGLARGLTAVASCNSREQVQ